SPSSFQLSRTCKRLTHEEWKEMQYWDVIIHANTGIFGKEQLTKTLPPIKEKFDVTLDTWIGQIDFALAKAIMDTCEPQTLGIVRPVRQFAQLYAFVRELRYEDPLHFDPDNVLAATVTLSRLVHPTSTGLLYAARVGHESGIAQNIFPAQTSGISKDV